MTLTCNQFVTQSYRLINPANPTQPLHGDDFKLGLLVLNQLLDSYAATGLLLTIAKTATLPIIAGQGLITVGPANILPVPDIAIGRLANLDSAWLNLQGVDYPLIVENRDEFLSSFKYAPLRGLPRFIITYPDTDVVRLQLYPAPSESFQFFIRGKFQLANLIASDTLSGLPGYYMRYLLFAVAKDMAMYKGRADAWTDKLEVMLMKAQDIMEAASEVNLSITGDRASLLNGAWRVKAGI
jgi:hypothetical protein